MYVSAEFEIDPDDIIREMDMDSIIDKHIDTQLEEYIESVQAGSLCGFGQKLHDAIRVTLVDIMGKV